MRSNLEVVSVCSCLYFEQRAFFLPEFFKSSAGLKAAGA